MARRDQDGMMEVMSARRTTLWGASGGIHALWELDGAALACKAPVAIVTRSGKSKEEEERYEHVTLFISCMPTPLLPTGLLAL